MVHSSSSSMGGRVALKPSPQFPSLILYLPFLIKLHLDKDMSIWETVIELARDPHEVS